MKMKRINRFGSVLVLAAAVMGWVLAPGVATAISVSQGSITIPGTFLFDLDAGAIAPAGADIWWEQVDSTTRMIAPQGAATLVNLGLVNFGSLTYAQLQSLTYTAAAINGSDVGNVLVPGDVFAVKTDLGNYAKVLVTGRFDSTQNNGLPIEWVTVNQTHQEAVPEASSTLPLFGFSALGLLGYDWRRRRAT